MSELPPADGTPSVTYPDGSTLGVEVDGSFVHLVARDDAEVLIRDTTLTPDEAHHLGDALVDASTTARGNDEAPALDDDALLDQFLVDDEELDRRTA